MFVVEVFRGRCAAADVKNRLPLVDESSSEMRAALLHEKCAENDLPKLEGNAGHQWFKQWRDMHGIAKKKVPGVKLNIPWNKVKWRIRMGVLGQYLPPARLLGNVPP